MNPQFFALYLLNSVLCFFTGALTYKYPRSRPTQHPAAIVPAMLGFGVSGYIWSTVTGLHGLGWQTGLMCGLMVAYGCGLTLRRPAPPE